MPTKILAVDDSPTMRMLLRATLTAQGFDVRDAEDGIAALDLLDGADERPDLVITDINMPRLDGFGLIAELRARPPFKDTPILVLSTESAPEKKAVARRAGATGWLVKPFDPVSLAAAIRRVLH